MDKCNPSETGSATHRHADASHVTSTLDSLQLNHLCDNDAVPVENVCTITDDYYYEKDAVQQGAGKVVESEGTHMGDGRAAPPNVPNRPAAANAPAWLEDFPSAPDKSDNAEMWRIYVGKAAEHDEALFKRWSEGIDTFLLITGLFSIVLSAFVITSWSMLQPDSGQAAVAGLVAVSQQLMVLSSGQPIEPSLVYRPETFIPPPWAVAVNGLWLTSLFISLSAAVLAMLVKQWLTAYNEDAAPVPLDRVQQRQLRYDGLNRWLVPGIISCLPLSTHLAVLLFFIGLVVFIWPVSAVLSVWMVALLSIGVCLYATSVVASLVAPDCSYKSPLGSVLYHVWSTYRLVIRGLRSILACRRLKDVEHGSMQIAESHVSSGLVEKAHIKQNSLVLQVKALAWLVKSPDTSVRETALLFLSWWRSPAQVWRTVREEVQQAAARVISNRLLCMSAKFHSSASEAIDLERIAMIASLVPDNSISGLHVKPIMDLPSDTTTRHHTCLASTLYMKNKRSTINDCRWYTYPSTILLCLRLEHHYTMASPPDAKMQHHWDGLISDLEKVSRHVSRADVPEMVLAKYVDLLTYALRGTKIEAKGRLVGTLSEDWILRYSLDAPITGPLIDCLQRLMEPSSLPPHWSGNETAAQAIMHALVTCVENSPRTPALDCHMLFEGLAAWTTASNSTTSAASSLLVTLLKIVDPPHLAAYYLSTLLPCLRYLLRNRLATESLDDAFRVWALEPARFEFCLSDDAQMFVHDGSMNWLVESISDTTLPLCVPAIVIAYVSMFGDKAEAESATVAYTLAYGKWLLCMHTYGVDYVVSRYPLSHSENRSRALQKLFECCIIGLMSFPEMQAQVGRLGLLDKYQEMSGINLRDSTATVSAIFQ